MAAGRLFDLPRTINIVLGIWLFFSAWLWPHTESSRANTMAVGIVVSNVAFWAAFVPALRRVSTAVMLWFLVSTLFIIPHLSRATVWHDMVVGFMALGASFARSTPPRLWRSTTRSKGRVAVTSARSAR